MEQSINYASISNSCDNLRLLASNFKDTIQQLNIIIEKIKSPSWSGDASTAFVTKIKELCSNLDDAKGTLAMAALFLAGCADGYKSIDNNSYNQLLELIGGQAKIDNTDVSTLEDPNLNEIIISQFTPKTTPEKTGEIPEEEPKKTGGQPKKSNGSSHYHTNNDGEITEAFVDTLQIGESISSTNENDETITDSNYNDVNGNSYYDVSDNNVSDNSYNDVSDNVNDEDEDEDENENEETSLELKKSVDIPSSIKQTRYTVTCYGKGGWYLGGGATPSKIASGSRQEKVHDIWLEQGCRYKNGIAVIDVDGTDRYLVALTKTFGVCGDLVDIKLKNGDVIHAILGDEKGKKANYYGHPYGNAINILELEVDRNVYNSLGNPTTNKWGLDWDSSQPITQINNYGSILS